MLRRLKLPFNALLLLLFLPLGAATQSITAVENSYAPVPFGPGERMTYRVRLGAAGEIGHGTIEVQKMDTLRGFPTYQLRLHLKGGITFLKVEDEYRSWLDAQSLISHRFYQDVNEVKYKRKRTMDFFPAERRWFHHEDNKSRPMPTDQPLDDLSFLYYVRTLPLAVGDSYTLDRYFKEDGNPVTVKVLRRETVTVTSGSFNTIVVQPIIKTKGLFSEGGKAEVYFTDDNRRIPVLIKTKLDVPLINSLIMDLQSYTPGQRLSPPFEPRPVGTP